MQDTKDLVVKSNELIEGHYNLSAASQKVSAAVISLVNPMDVDNPLPEFSFTIKEFAELLDVTERRVRKIIDTVTLELKQVVITLRKRNSESYRRVGLFNYCDYNDEDKTIGFHFEPALDIYIRDFAKSFTQYQLEQIRELKSKYSIRLYEILRKSHPIKSKNKVSYYQVEIEELKKMVGLKPNSYKGRYDRFRAAVLEVSQKELANKTDICFDFELIRKGRKAHAIKFHIKHNEEFEAEDKFIEGEVEHIKLINDSEYDFIVRSIKQMILDISDMELEMILQMYPKTVVQESLLDLFSAITQRSDVGDKLSYFKGILSNKMKEYQKDLDTRKPKTTEEKLTDKSWADGIDSDDLGCYPDDC